jgi:hypothetical protein
MMWLPCVDIFDAGAQAPSIRSLCSFPAFGLIRQLADPMTVADAFEDGDDQILATGYSGS